MTLFEKIKRIRRGDPAIASVSLRVSSEVSKFLSKSGVFLYRIRAALTHFPSTVAAMPATMFPNIMIKA